MMRTFFMLLATILTMQAGLALGAAVKSEDVAVQMAVKYTAAYRLTTLRSGCLYFDTHDEGRSWLVRVREKHDRACGGLPAVSPVLYYMRLEKDDGVVTTTAYDPDNVQFERLRDNTY